MCCTGNFEFVGEGVEPMIVLHEEEALGGFFLFCHLAFCMTANPSFFCRCLGVGIPNMRDYFLHVAMFSQ
jgi:hypothetical protein